MEERLTGQGGSVVEVEGETQAAQYHVSRHHVLLQTQPIQQRLERLINFDLS